MDEILTSLSEMIRSLSRISNKNPESVNETDLKRLENAKRILSSNTIIDEKEIPKQQNMTHQPKFKVGQKVKVQFIEQRKNTGHQYFNEPVIDDGIVIFNDKEQKFEIESVNEHLTVWTDDNGKNSGYKWWYVQSKGKLIASITPSTIFYCMETGCIKPSTKEYSEDHFVCDRHYESLNDYFDEEYD